MSSPDSINLDDIAKLAPKGWDELLAITGSKIGGPAGSTLDEGAVGQVYDHVHTLPDDVVEEAYYFGLRPLMAGIEKELQDPAAQQEATLLATRALIGRWQSISYNDETHTKFRVNDLQVLAYDNPLRKIIDRANLLVPTDWRVLADVLTIDVQGRRDRRYEQQGGRFDFGRPLSPEYQFESVLFGLPTTIRASDNSMAGSFTMVRTALHEMYKHAGGTIKMVGSTPDLPLVEAIQFISELDKKFGMLAMRCATFRLDQFPHVLNECVKIDGEGRPTFDPKPQKAIREQPRPQKAARLSDPTYRCPAVFSGIIPTIVDMAVQTTGMVHDELAPTQKASPRILRFLRGLLRQQAPEKPDQAE